MLCSSQSGITKRAKLPLARCFLSAAAILSCQPGDAAQPQDLLSPPSMESLSIKWTPGPDNARLDAVAFVQVPQGYRFTDAEGARIELGQKKIVVPQTVIGLLEPLSGDGYVLLEFTPLGYVMTRDKNPLDADAMLKAASDRIKGQDKDLRKQGMAAVSAIEWESKPVYDASQHTLDWALRKEIQGEKVVNHTVRLLGRRGVLDITAIGSSKDLAGPVSFEKIVQGISFREGEDYASYRSGDKLAASGLADIVINDGSSNGSSSYRNLYAWGIGLVLIICAVATGALVALKKTNRRRTSHSQAPARAVAPSKAVAADTSLEPSPSAPESKSGLGAGLKPKTALPPVALKKNGFFGTAIHHHNHSRHALTRKKVFDYNRYFADLMSTVSSHGNLAEAVPANGYASETDRLSAPAEPVQSESVKPLVVLNNNSEMIEQQKALIEDQKRLIQEQTRLIEEKSRLISEKNQLLKMQSELIDTKLV